MPLVRTPLWASSCAAATSSSKRFAGQRPLGCPKEAPGRRSSFPTRHRSVFLVSTAPPLKFSSVAIRRGVNVRTGHAVGLGVLRDRAIHDFMARVIGSQPGFSAPAQPVQTWANSLPPLALSTFATSVALGKPWPRSHMRHSRISQPASSIAEASRCHVRVPPKANISAPGLQTRAMACQYSGPGTGCPVLAHEGQAVAGGDARKSTDFSARSIGPCAGRRRKAKRRCLGNASPCCLHAIRKGNSIQKPHRET